MSDYIKRDEAIEVMGRFCMMPEAMWAIKSVPSIDIVFCKECKHRPKLSDENGEKYGFNVEEVSGRCPCICEDGWYSWMPPDGFYCGYGERKEGE